MEPADATDLIRQLANGSPTLVIRKHAKEQMLERGLITGDLLHVMKKGFVYETQRNRPARDFISTAWNATRRTLIRERCGL